MSSITFSFIPNEVIAPGTLLELHLPRAMSAASARAAKIGLYRAGREVFTIVSLQDILIQIFTDRLAPANYQVSVSKLLDANGQIITEPVVVPVVIGAFRGRIAKELRIQHVVHLAVGDLSATRLHPGEEAPAGTQYLEIIKAVNIQTGQPTALAFDGEGKPIDSLATLAQVNQRRFAKFGRLHETLWNHLQTTADNELVNIVVWPIVDGSHANYEKPNNRCIKEPLPEEQEIIKGIQVQRSKMLDALKKFNAQVLGEGCEIPCVSASLTAGDVRKLAELDDVGYVLLEDCRGVNDLKDSLAIARADKVQSLGINGTDVRVAVFEEGPSDTSDLIYAGRFQTSPPASDHARLTSAVIKNVEECKPHGYAPNCDLYSANSYSNDALRWAASQGCTVISQSFHRAQEQTTATLSGDDILKDYLALHWPYPTIVHAAGNGDSTEYVNHKGYNTLTVGNHDDNAAALASDSVFRNPTSTHSDRELPELVANGTGVTGVGVTMSGTSFAAPAVAGIVALLQDVDGTLKSWPEGCRAILLASAGRNVTGSTWWDDVSADNDAHDGAGAADAEAGVKIAQQRKSRNAPASDSGWDVGTLATADIGVDKGATFHYYVQVPNIPGTMVVKAALAWDNVVATDASDNPLSSTLTVDLDLSVQDGNGNYVAWSASYDNSYEIVEFVAVAGQIYQINIRRWSGTDNAWYGVAWTVITNDLGQSTLLSRIGENRVMESTEMAK